MSAKSALGALALTFLVTYAMGQGAEYYRLIQKGDDLYRTKQYKKAAMAYSDAFRISGGYIANDEHYNAACIWALAGYKDSAFAHLQHITSQAGFKNYKRLVEDADLDGLHHDVRWTTLCKQVKQNKDMAEARQNKALVARLARILDNDQKYRMQLGPVGEKYGDDSKEVEEVWKAIALHDSLNEIEVVALLEKYGWPGIELVGEEGAEPLFLVIQHAPIAIQDKYLPMVREAVDRGDARRDWLALLEDRVAIRHGRRQIYGSQISGDEQGMYLAPLIDPDNVDERRATAHMAPLAGYLQNFGMKWNVDEYKKQLPDIERREAARHIN